MGKISTAFTRSAALVALLSAVVDAATGAEWRSRSIYQVLTDRFARTDGSTTATCNTQDRVYCGGTYDGLINKLDYIQDMGFTAIWISPVITNIDDGDNNGAGAAFHGYWGRDYTTLNSHFGSESDLKALSTALHDRGMYLMVDIVVNDMAYPGAADAVDYSTFVPFNSQSDFHQECFISNYENQTDVEDCWLGDNTVALADLDTTNQDVIDYFYTWIADLVSNYSIDGLRIDTARHVQKDFWTGFTEAAGVYTVGEIFDGDPTYVCPYQGPLTGVLNYPIYYQILAAFQSTSGSISALTSMLEQVKDDCADSTLLATFSENHDNPRFASVTQDISLAKNAIAYVILSDGPPIIYEGQEQHYAGGADPDNREAVWLSGYSTTSTLYTHTAVLNQVRNQSIFKSGDNYLTYKAWAIYSDSHNVAVRKGADGEAVIAALTNVGASGSTQSFTVSNTGYTGGSTIYDILSCTSLTANSDGSISVSLTGGLPKVFYPQSQISGSGICSQ